MKLRREEGWRADVVGNKESPDWYTAAARYNMALRDALGPTAVVKRSSALKDLLESVERQLIQQYKSKNWTCELLIRK